MKSAGSLDATIHELKANLATEAAKLGISFTQLSAMKLSFVSGGKETEALARRGPRADRE